MKGNLLRGRKKTKDNQSSSSTGYEFLHYGQLVMYTIYTYKYMDVEYGPHFSISLSLSFHYHRFVNFLFYIYKDYLLD